MTQAEVDGSFYWPPPFKDAEHLVSFWSQVKIPDEAMTRLNQAYMIKRHQEVQAAIASGLGPRMAEWDRAHPEPQPGVFSDREAARSAHAQARQAAQHAFQEELREQAEGERRMRIPTVEMRTCARALKIWWFTVALREDAEAERALDLPIASSNVQGWTTTRETMEKFDLEDLSPVLDDPGDSSSSDLARQFAELQRGQETVTGKLERIDRWLQNVRAKTDYLISHDPEDLKKRY